MQNVLISAWRALPQIALWLGLGLCMVAVYRMAPEISTAFNRTRWPTILGLTGTLLATWLLAVAAWRVMVDAFVARRMSWRVAIRQSGLLLMGKYIPGGIFGLVARASDPDNGDSRQVHLGIGMYEQIGKVAVMTGTGLVLLVSSLWRPAALIALPLIPAASAEIIYLTHRIIRPIMKRFLIQAHSPKPKRSALISALFITQASCLGWSVIVFWISVDIFSQPIPTSIGLAGAFGISVVIGSLAVFMPGGIGVREMSMVGLASHWLPLQEAVTLAALLRILSVALDCVAGVASLLLMPRAVRHEPL